MEKFNIKSLIIVAFIFITFNVYSQSYNIGGITINTSYTHNSIIETLGVPSSCDSLMTDSYGDVKTYHYGDDSFTFALEDGTMVGCLITSTAFKLNGIAGVGDNISALSSTTAVKGNGDYYAIESDTHIITIYYENDIITKLTVSAKL
ncbi:MAG: hypothetical protein J6C80_02335 [Flavobacteriales bacterium]|nr:hypothetical protein [Flavobacteriales bacterium]